MSIPEQLAQASPTTRSWLASLQAMLPDLEYGEKRYWASFRLRSPRSAVAYLNPSKNKIRLFLPLEPLLHDYLRVAPSTKAWKDRFPSVFEIRDSRDLAVAAEFILWAAARAKPIDPLPMEPVISQARVLNTEAIPVAVDTGVQLTIIRQRRGQDRLRQWVLVNYGDRCALCDISDRNLLVASHIVRWADAPEHRGALSNVICLCCLHDALFERGFWSLADDFTVLRREPASGQVINALLPPVASFRAPSKEAPSSVFLAHHRARFGF